MTNDHAYIRQICIAKRSELAGQPNLAIYHLGLAARLTCQPDDLMQIAAWRERLEETPKPRSRRIKR